MGGLSPWSVYLPAALRLIGGEVTSRVWCYFSGECAGMGGGEGRGGDCRQSKSPKHNFLVKNMLEPLKLPLQDPGPEIPLWGSRLLAG